MAISGIESIGAGPVSALQGSELLTSSMPDPTSIPGDKAAQASSPVSEGRFKLIIDRLESGIQGPKEPQGFPDVVQTLFAKLPNPNSLQSPDFLSFENISHLKIESGDFDAKNALEVMNENFNQGVSKQIEILKFTQVMNSMAAKITAAKDLAQSFASLVRRITT